MTDEIPGDIAAPSRWLVKSLEERFLGMSLNLGCAAGCALKGPDHYPCQEFVAEDGCLSGVRGT